MGHGEGGDKVWMAYIKSKDTVAWEAFKNGSENVFVLVLAHLEPELELFEVWEIMVLKIIITIIANVINFKQL